MPNTAIGTAITTETSGRDGAGCEVLVYQGDELSHNRAGGPTCLTRPILRDMDRVA